MKPNVTKLIEKIKNLKLELEKCISEKLKIEKKLLAYEGDNQIEQVVFLFSINL